jgi:glutaredoxin
VYGRPSCGWCTKVKGDFDKAGIPYRFADCDADPANNSEMWDFLRANNHKGAVGLPVVNMYGILKIQADATVEAAKAAKNGKGGVPVKIEAPKPKPSSGGAHTLPDISAGGKTMNSWVKEDPPTHPDAPTSGWRG